MTPTTVAAAVAAVLTCLPTAWLVWKVTRYVRGGVELRRSMRQAVMIRLRWPRLARLLDLYVKDPTPRLPRLRRLARSREPERVLSRVHPRLPRLRLRADEFGVIVRAKTLAGVGLVEWQKHAQHLSDEWAATRVSVEQDRPGRLIIRAVRRDPLTVPLPVVPSGDVPETLASVVIGLDEYARPVPMRFAGVPGIGIYGLPGAGKTSLINTVLSTLAPSPCVQLAIIDGKGEPGRPGADYEDLSPRAWLSCGSDLTAARDILLKVEDLRQKRAATVRETTGGKNVWTSGPDGAPGFSREWPLVLVVVDEAHSFMNVVRDGGNQTLKTRNALAAEIIMLVEGLVKLARSVGIVTILATQKGTGDAIPTQVRDVCPVSLAFAVKTRESAVAALGADIGDYPEASPVALQDPELVGVAVMSVSGKQGFTRVRTAYTTDEDAARVIAATAHLTADPTQLLPNRRLSVVEEPQSPSEAA